MIRKLALIGLVVLVVGVVLLLVGATETAGAVHHLEGFHDVSPGMYASAELNLTAAATITLQHPPSGMGVVTGANLSVVNATNLGSVGLTPIGSSSGAVSYLVDAGSYYVVYFGSSAPSTSVIWLYTSQAALYGIATLVGLVSAAVGGVVALIGAIKKPKSPVAANPATPPP